MPSGLDLEGPASSEDTARADCVVALFGFEAVCNGKKMTSPPGFHNTLLIVAPCFAIPGGRASSAEFGTAVAAALVMPFAPDGQSTLRCEFGCCRGYKIGATQDWSCHLWHTQRNTLRDCAPRAHKAELHHQTLLRWCVKSSGS